MFVRLRDPGGVLNLCFHGVGDPARALEAEEERYWIAPDVFEAILAVVNGNDTVRLSFDDGNASDVTLALPALLRRGLHATFFVVAGRCGRPGSLSIDDVRTLACSGMTVGSHGMRHRPWRFLDDEALHEELGDAASLLSDAAGQPVTDASCPFGAYDRRVLRALRRHRFARVYSVDDGRADPGAWLQPRYTIRADDTPRRIAELVRDRRPSVAHTLKTAAKRWR